MSGDLPTLALAFGAGLVTVASPCVLPVLPIVLGAAAGRHNRWRPVFVIVGFVATFVVAALLFGASTDLLGLGADRWRQLAAAGLCVAGLLMLWPALADKLQAPLQRWTAGAGSLADRAGAGPGGGLLLGAALGLLWTPCAGPVLAALLALVAGARAAEAAPALLAFALGSGLPMLAIAYGGQAAALRMRAVAGRSGAIRRGFGALVMASAAAMLTGEDVLLAAELSRLWPSAGSVDAESNLQPGEAAPEFAHITAWLNGPPTSLQALRGQVVLLDFWTFGCVNCVRTLPMLARLHARFAAEGLVVVGVHTPEFAHERSLDGLRNAVARHNITYAVAQDNRHATWDAYRIRHWPTLVLVDAHGRVIFRHIGEGDEELVEAQVKAALRRDARDQ